MWWEYIKAVVLVVAIIAAAFYVTRLVAVKGTGGAKNSAIRILGTRALGRDRQVVMTEIGEKIYVLGVTAQNISLIDTLPAGEYHAGEVPAEPGPGIPPTTGKFAKEFLDRFKGTYRGP